MLSFAPDRASSSSMISAIFERIKNPLPEFAPTRVKITNVDVNKLSGMNSINLLAAA